MSRRTFATEKELHDQLPELAQYIWQAASPDDQGLPSSDPIFGGTYAEAEGSMPAEVNVTRALARLDELRAALRKIK